MRKRKRVRVRWMADALVVAMGGPARRVRRRRQHRQRRRQHRGS